MAHDQPRSSVRNAADPRQVSKAARRDDRRREDELNDLRAVLSTPAGRRWTWRLLVFCGVHRSIWDPSLRIHFNAGKQDTGHFVEAEVGAADPELLFQMQREASERARREEAEIAAAHTPRVSEGETDA